MRKLLLVCLLTLLVLGAMVMPVGAQSVSELTALAAFFPDTAPMFAVTRVDNDFIAKLDLLMGQARELLPPGALPPVTLSQTLDEAMLNGPYGSDYETAIGSWLGDTVALGMLNMNTDRSGPAVGILVSITDKEAATTFLETALEYQIESGRLTRSDSEAGTMFLPSTDSFDQTAYIVTNQVIGISSAGASYFQLPSSPLSRSAIFTESLALLPASSYDMLFYMDVATITTASMEAMRNFGPNDNPMQPLVEDMYGVLGPQVYGITTLDTRTIVIDIVQRVNDTSALEERGLIMTPGLTPIDPAFAAHIPADAPLVLHSTGLGASTLNSFQNLRVMGDFIYEQMQATPPPTSFNYYESDGERFLREFNLGNIVTFINLSFAGMTGLNLENDVLRWMEGDYAMYLRVLPLSGDLPMTVDLALVTQASDPAAAAQTVSAVASALEQYRLNFSSESIGDGQALAITAPLRLILPAEMRAFTTNVAELDMLVGSSGDLFAVGTRKAVSFSLSPKGGSLADSPNYVEAQAYFLEGAQAVMYLDTRGLVSTIDGFLPMMSRFERRDMEGVRTALGLFNSMSVSTVYTADNASVGRFVLTLGQQPIPVIEETDGVGSSGSSEPAVVPTSAP